jgi:hypothetical protein
MKERDPGPIWGGWWFWEPPPGKVKENRPPERKSHAEILAKRVTESDKDFDISAELSRLDGKDIESPHRALADGA